MKWAKLLSAAAIDGFAQSPRDAEQQKPNAQIDNNRSGNQSTGGYIPVEKPVGPTEMGFVIFNTNDAHTVPLIPPGLSADLCKTPDACLSSAIPVYGASSESTYIPIHLDSGNDTSSPPIGAFPTDIDIFDFALPDEGLSSLQFGRDDCGIPMESPADSSAPSVGQIEDRRGLEFLFKPYAPHIRTDLHCPSTNWITTLGLRIGDLDLRRHVGYAE